MWNHPIPKSIESAILAEYNNQVALYNQPQKPAFCVQINVNWITVELFESRCWIVHSCKDVGGNLSVNIYPTISLEVKAYQNNSPQFWMIQITYLKTSSSVKT